MHHCLVIVKKKKSSYFIYVDMTDDEKVITAYLNLICLCIYLLKMNLRISTTCNSVHISFV